VSDEQKQKEKDEALQRRKEELEGELERYAQAGAFSPGLIKFTKWLSRALYLAMAVAFMVMLFSGWGKVSEEDFERVNDAYTKWKAEADKQKSARTEAEGRLVDAEIRAARLKLELEQAKSGGSEEADAAQERARNLIDRAWGERAYAEHWREKLKSAQPDTHGVEPVAGVTLLIQQAAGATAGQRIELMRETADFGAAAIEQAAKSALASADPEARKIAARLLWRLGKPRDPRELREENEGVLRELWFCHALAHEYYGAVDTWLPEAFVAAGMTPRPDAGVLDKAYRSAPEQNRLDLLALMAEVMPADPDGVFAMVATSQRPLPEKIIAVRWMGARKHEGGRALLKTLSEGSDALAAEAKEALAKLDG